MKEKMMKRKSVNGFTLIEMLVVVLIIGILAGIALPQYQNAKIKADFAEVFIKLKTAAQIEEMCRLQYGAEECYDIYVPSDVYEEVAEEIREFSNSNFDYQSMAVSGDSNLLALAHYKKEDVCICITKNYQFILQENECDGNETTKNYSKILGIPEDTDCWCC